MTGEQEKIKSSVCLFMELPSIHLKRISSKLQTEECYIFSMS